MPRRSRIHYSAFDFLVEPSNAFDGMSMQVVLYQTHSCGWITSPQLRVIRVWVRDQDKLNQTRSGYAILLILQLHHVHISMVNACFILLKTARILAVWSSMHLWDCHRLGCPNLFNPNGNLVSVFYHIPCTCFACE